MKPLKLNKVGSIRKNLRGKVIGELTVGNRYSSTQGKRETRYRCTCSCGQEVIVLASRLTCDDDKKIAKRSCGGSLGHHKKPIEERRSMD